jgi:transcriptional regulator with XRE-family HTH domain
MGGESSSNKRFPNRIRQLRMEKELTQGQLARLMGYESVSSLASLEAGKKLPSMKTLIKLEAVFQRPFRDLYPRYFDAIYDPAAKRRTEFFRNRANGPQDR